MATGQHPLRIVLIGKTGVGKSAAGNTLLGQKAFRSSPLSNGCTEICEKRRGVNVGRTLDVIDTPGILDPEKETEEIKREIIRCIKVSCPGPHAFLLVMSVGRFTKEEQNAVRGLQEIFGKRAADYMIVLFTRGDQLEGLPISNYVQNARTQLRDVVKSCGGRFHVFSNKVKDDRQVAGLITKIDEMVALNGGGHFSEAMYKEVDQVVRQKGEAVELDFFEFSFLMLLLQRVALFQRILQED